MNIDNETFEEILWNGHEDFETVTKREIVNQSRWSIYKSQVFKQISTGKFFEAYWGEGATEMQRGQGGSWLFTEVEPEEVLVVKYKPVKDGQKFGGYSE
jgi:hypothetical protein